MPVYTARNPLDTLQTENPTNTGPYQFSYLTYPLDFDDTASFGHYMNFYINVNKNSRYLTSGKYNTGPYGATNADYATSYTPAYGSRFPGGAYTETTAQTLGGNSGFPGGNPFYFLQDILNGNIPGYTAENPSLNVISQTRITQAISLYIPDSMSFSSQYDWQDASLTDLGGKLLKGGQIGGGAMNEAFKSIEGKASEGLKHLGAGALADIIAGAGGPGSGLGDVGLGIAGLAVNPQIFVLFRGVDLRTFAFDFIFTPKSPEEAANVRNIVKAFRFHAAPEIDNRIGRYFIAPSTFNVEYMYRGQRNQNIFQMSTCVIQRIHVDYAPYGWSTFNDGQPVQTHLSLVMKETEILTKEKINSGF